MDVLWYGIFLVAAVIPFIFLLKAKKAKTIIIFSMITYIFPVLFGIFLAWLVTFYVNR